MTLCYRCSLSLVTEQSTSELILEPAFGEKDCVGLILAISKGDLDTIGPRPVDEFESYLSRYLPDLARVVGSLAERSGAQRNAHENPRPSLSTLLKKAHASGCSVSSILIDPKTAAASSGQCITDYSFVPKTSRPRRDADVGVYVHSVLSEILNSSDETEIPPLGRISEELGVSQGYIRHQFPDLVLRWQSSRRVQSAMKIGRQNRACHDELKRLRIQRIAFCSMKALEQHLSRTADCSIHVARRAMLSTHLPVSDPS